MNKIKITITSLLLLLVVTTSLAQKREYAGKMRIDPVALQQIGDSLYVELLFDISGVNVDPSKSISLIPSLVTSSRRLALPAVEVKGKSNYRVYERELSLMSAQERKRYRAIAPYAVVRGYNTGESKQIFYRKTIAYQEWMAEARLDMQEDLCACGGAPRTLAMSQLINQISFERTLILEPYRVTPHLAYVRPETEVIKYRERSAEAFLDFAVGRTDIRPDYMNNPRELKKITDLIAEVKEDKSVIVNKIDVIGFSSPEGPMAENRQLSQGRANALVDYLTQRIGYPRSLYNVAYGGENWSGLKAAVQASQMPWKEKVLYVIENESAEINYVKNSSRKKTLQSLNGGNAWRYMAKEFFAALRVAQCRINYVAKECSITEARAVFQTNPYNLSLEEMFCLANTYEEGSFAFNDVFETAVRLFPEDPIANLNAGAAALSRGDAVYAERYLGQVKTRARIPEYDNAMGVLLLLKGDLDRAESYLSAAAATGLVAAERNLEELAQKRENIRQMAEQKRQFKK